MKRVKNRARAVYILAGLLLVGFAVYIVRYLSDGEAWVQSRVNQGAYAGGLLNTGSVYDRNGVLLASSSGGVRRYADDYAVRVSSLHAVGDYAGNIGSGALNAFIPELLGYTPVNGTYSRDGAGGTLSLTIDASLQTAAWEALAGRRGAVLVMNYRTGELLCMVSSPSFDPASPPDLSLPQYEGAYLNRALGSVFTPGSVFKIVTLAAALENLPDLSARRFHCAGSTVVDGRTVTCSGTHGEQTIELAFANSCNIAFAQLALELGADTLEAEARALGLLSGHGIDGIPTAAGSFTKGEEDSAELAWSGVGQGEDLAAPYSILRLSAAIANGGVAPEGHLLLGAEAGESRRILSETTARELADMMSYNVVYSYGEGNFPGLKLCAKTGTAEVGSGPPHAWFTGFLRDRDHPLAFAVLVENGGGGLAAAAPVANAVLQRAVSGPAAG